MKKQLMKYLCLGTFVCLLLTACGSATENANSAPESDAVAAEDTNEQATDSTGDLPTEEGFVAADSIPTTHDDAGNEELPDYLQMDALDETALTEEATAGEGVAALAGEVVTLKADAKELSFGETVTVETAYGDYELTVDAVSLTDERNPDDTEDVPDVLLLTYHYTNTAYSDSFLLGDVSFKVLDDKNAALPTYALSNVPAEEIPAPAPVEQGETAEVVLAYALHEKTDSVRIVFDDLVDDNGVEYYWDINFSEIETAS